MKTKILQNHGYVVLNVPWFDIGIDTEKNSMIIQKAIEEIQRQSRKRKKNSTEIHAFDGRESNSFKNRREH